MLFTESYWVVVCAKIHALLSAIFMVGGGLAAVYLLVSAAYLLFLFCHTDSASDSHSECPWERRGILRSWYWLIGAAIFILVVSVVVPDPVKTRQYENSLDRPDYAVEGM